MVPSTYEAGTLYNVLPSGNRAPDETGENSGYDQTRADFTFDRGTNAAATRIGSDGLIKKYRENLLLQSNDLTNSQWVKSRVTASTDTSVYPNGFSSSTKILETTDNGQHYVRQLHTGISGAVYTASCYIKGIGRNYAKIEVLSLSTPYELYLGEINLTTGSITKTFSGATAIDAVAADLGNGWYRISVTGLISGKTNFGIQLYPLDDSRNGSYVGDVSKGLYVSGFQFETSLVATDYLESTSVTGKAGVLIDLPRIDYSSGAGALLLEPQRQQLVKYSEYFEATDWIDQSIDTTLELVSSGSPDGGAFYRCTSGASGGGRIVDVFTGSMSGGVFSLYAKGSGSLMIDLYITGGSNVTETITLTSEWTRYDVYNSRVDSGGDASIRFYPNAVADIYGAQVESGPYATSYIPNHGESGGVTRAADSCSVTGVSDVIGQTEGTIFVDLAGFDGNTHLVTLGDGTINNYLMLYIASNSIAWLSNAGLTGSAGSVTATSKVALAYKENDSVLYLDGSQVLSDTSNTIPSLPNIYLNNNATLSNVLRLEAKQVTLFNERLSNAELAALTA